MNDSPLTLPLLLQSHQALRSYVSGGPRPDISRQKLKAWPFIFIFLSGSGIYVLMVKARANAESPKPRNQQRR
ncbi:MAG: hypothetical protein Q9194_005740 [Teloschistes cf. exilis]